MTYILKGFIQFTNAIASSSGIINNFGELSTQSMTYSRSKKLYVDAVAANYTLVAFNSKISNSSTEVPVAIKDKIFEITNWVINVQKSNNKYTTKAALISAISTNFSSSITNVNIGELLADNDNTLLPTSVSFTQLGIGPNDPASNNEIKIWLNDQSFLNEYDECEVIVIPPVKSLESFFTTKPILDPLLSNYRDNDLLQAISTIKASVPESSINTENFIWLNKDNSNVSTVTRWTLLVYGRINDTQDYIKDAVKLYLSTNSTRTINEWTKVFPDIFKNTEFVILPRWQNYSILERQLQVGQHNPLVNLAKELKYAKAILTNYTTSFIESYLTVVPIQYKSLAALILPGQDNRNSLFNINEVLPDILNVPTSDILYESMGAQTKEWIQLFIKAIVSADSNDLNNTVPLGMRKVTRANMSYISFKYNSVEYLVSTKATTPNYIS